VTAPPVGVAQRWRAAAAVVASAAPLFPPHVPLNPATSLYVPPCAIGYGAVRRARCRCVAQRVLALTARVLHARAWNYSHSLKFLPLQVGHKYRPGLEDREPSKSYDGHIYLEQVNSSLLQGWQFAFVCSGI